MRKIKSNMEQDKIVEDLNIIIDAKSNFVLIEDGMAPVENCINIIFSHYNVNVIHDLLKESGYYKQSSAYLLGKNNQDLELVHTNDIVYIEGINNDTFLHTENQEYLSKQKLYELEAQLIDRLFIRIAKSYIVSISKIKKIKPTFNGKLLLIMRNDIKLEVSRCYLGDFRKLLGM